METHDTEIKTAIGDAPLERGAGEEVKAPTKDELRQKLRQRVSDMSNRRSGVNLRSAKASMPKKQKNSLMKDIRKQGIRALTKKLGINDPEIERMVADMIRTGETQNADDLIRKITELQAKKKRDAEAKKMAEQPIPSEILDLDAADSVIPTLPGASQKRKTLKPLHHTLLPSSVKAKAMPDAGFQQWLQKGGTSSEKPASVE